MNNQSLQHGHYYHIYSKGNNVDSIFNGEGNYAAFLSLYKKYLFPIADLFAYCLLPTHFQLLFQVKPIERIDRMYWEGIHLWHQVGSFFGIYTKQINQIRQRRGSLFNRRISRIMIQERTELYDLIYLIHLSPEGHGIVADYRNWPFSSFTPYLKRDRRSLLARQIFSDDELYHDIVRHHQDLSNGCVLKELFLADLPPNLSSQRRNYPS
jgi:hypothetical protein